MEISCWRWQTPFKSQTRSVHSSLSPGGEKSNLNVKPRPQDKVSPPPLSQPSALDLAEVGADFREAIFPEWDKWECLTPFIWRKQGTVLHCTRHGARPWSYLHFYINCHLSLHTEKYHEFPANISLFFIFSNVPTISLYNAMYLIRLFSSHIEEH